MGSKLWGIYIRFGNICMTKRIGCLRMATKRYNRLIKRKPKADVWFALVPLHND